MEPSAEVLQLLADAKAALLADRQHRVDAANTALTAVLTEFRCDLVVEVTLTSHAGTTFLIRPRALD